MCLTLVVAGGVPDVIEAQTIHQVSPRTIDRAVSPGEIVDAEIQVTNTYPYVINVFPSVHDLIVVNTEAGQEREVVVTEDSQFIDWTFMTRAAQRLQPGATGTIAARFTLPQSLEPGTYHGLLGFGQGIDRPTAEAAVLRGTAPGVVLRFTVPEPDVRTDGAASLDIAEYVVVPEQSAVSYTLYNPGTRPMVPTGEIVIRSPRGAEVAALPISMTEPLLPGEIRVVATSVPALSLPGRYRAEARVDFNDSQVALVSMTDTFWFIPWPVLLLVIGVILVLTMLLYRYLSRVTGATRVPSDQSVALPLHVYRGESEPEDHDINLRT
jgi:hypothetical protein